VPQNAKNIAVSRGLDGPEPLSISKAPGVMLSPAMQDKIELTEDEQRNAFNRELANRLPSLDRSEYIDPKSVRDHLEQKSREWSNRT
jgi:hypothetical protein